MEKSRKANELRVAEQIVSVLPAGSALRICDDDSEAIRFVVRAAGLKLRAVVLRRESLRRLVDDPAGAVKIEYLQRDLLRSVSRRTEFQYPRGIRRVAQKVGRAARRALTITTRAAIVSAS
jgi:hypothetical protein